MRRDLAAITGTEHDLLVVGGGIHGAAAAWDAAQRGLRVALIEAADFGSGTSWNSLKTIHGGLRYLQKLDLRRMRESIGDRRALLRIAPALVRPLPFLVPTCGRGLQSRTALGLALRLNDLVARDRNRGLPGEWSIPPGRVLARAEALARSPGLSQAGLTGAAVWYDAQVSSSERLTLGFLHAASASGAALANYVRATGFVRGAAGRVNGVTARDVLAGDSLILRARLTLVSAGPWLEELLALAGLRRPAVPLLSAINLVLKRQILSGLAVGGRADDRYLFLVPWRDRSLVGTDYAPADTARTLGERVASLVAHAQRVFPWAGLTEADVALAHEGRVPGRASAAGLLTRDMLFDHEREDGVPGLISVLPVKYTTARAVAQRTIDLASRRLRCPAAPCRTAETPLTWATSPTGSLEEQARRAVRQEAAVHLGDAVLRRLDLGTAGRPAGAEVESVARTMAAELSWSEARVQAERDDLDAFFVSRQG